MLKTSSVAVFAAGLVFATTAHAQSICEFTGKFPPSCSSAAPLSTPDLALSRSDLITIDPANITTEALIPAFRRAFQSLGCEMALEGGQETFAVALGAVIAAPAEALQDRDGPWFRPIGTAFDYLKDRGVVFLDQANSMIRFPDCAS